jgi:hypothetical protein
MSLHVTVVLPTVVLSTSTSSLIFFRVQILRKFFQRHKMIALKKQMCIKKNLND